MEEMETYYLVIFLRKSGKIKLTASGLSKGMLELMALQKTAKNQDAMIVKRSNGQILWYVENHDGYPTVIDQQDEIHNRVLDDLCPGLLNVLKESN